MSDHPGLCTFHAERPETAVHRMAVIMFADAQVRMEAAKEIFIQAVDLVVQIG
jgi:pilus assembly protein CpaF